jgi:hypothetical protein
MGDEETTTEQAESLAKVEKRRPAKKARKRNAAKRTTKKTQKEVANAISPKVVIGAAIVLVALYLVYSSMGGGGSSGLQNQTTQNLTGGFTPDNKKVNLIVLNDQRCGQDCDVSPLLPQLKQVFPGLSVKNLDYGSSEGKKFADDAGLTALPALVFDKSVTESNGFQLISKYVIQAGGYLSLRIGAAWDPYCDPTPEHCSDDKCKDRISCRPETPGKLDLYVMSWCPYGIMAMDSMKEVLTAFKGELNFSLNYIGDLDASGQPTSLHGQGEIEEDKRELCSIRYYPGSYMEYIWCRNKDIQASDWQKCATENGMDAAKIKACAEGEEGKNLISENFKSGQSLNIMGSPTFLINNKKTFNAVTAADIQFGICGMNKNLKGCAATLSNLTASGVPGGSCAPQ